MEESPKYGVTLLALPPTEAPTLTSLLLAYQAEANGLLAAAGYPAAQAQVSANILPSGPNYIVSAVNPDTVLFETLSFGMGATPEAALNEFNARLVPAEAAAAGILREAA